MEKVAQTYDNYIEKLMTQNAKDNKSALNSELINKIPLTDVYTNSITVAVGKQRSGKTRKIIKEIIKVSKMHNETHMLIYVNKTGNKMDKTFESFKDLISLPIVYCSQDDCEDMLRHIITYKEKYNQLIQSQDPDEIDDTDPEVVDILDNLGLEDFSRPYLHTLVLLDDIANSPMLKKPTTYMNSLLTQCAHINMSFFLSVQYWIGLPANIKSQATVVFMFGGFSKQQLHYLLGQMSLQNPFDEIWDIYKTLKSHDFFTVDIPSSEYTVNLVKLSKEEKKNKDNKKDKQE